MKNAVIYTRVSTTEQDSGLASQNEDLNRWAEANKLTIVKSFSESVSGYDKTKERAEYEKMKQYVVDSGIKTILIWELSRLGRSTSKTLKEIEYFRDLKINIFFKKENLNTLSDSATDKLLLSMLSSIAEFERSTIITRTTRGRNTAAENGKAVSLGILPYGYSRVNSVLVKNDEEAKVVEEIFRMAERGVPLRSIAGNLNSLHIPTRHTLSGRVRTLNSGDTVGIVWRNNTIKQILKRRLYTGERLFGNGIKATVPAIVSKELWSKVQERFTKHLGYIDRTKYEYLFKGKLFCGHCSSTYTSRTENRYATKPSFYQCSGTKDNSIGCKAGQFKSTVLDAKLYDLLFRHQDSMVKVHKDTTAQNGIESKKQQIEFYRNEIVKLEAQKKRVIGLYKEGYIEAPELKRDITALRNATLEMDNNISGIEKTLAYASTDLAGILAKMFNEKEFASKREFVQTYVDKVIVYNVEQSEIDYSELVYIDMRTAEKKKFTNNNRKVLYIEMFAFGNQTPMKVIMSSSELVYTSDKLSYNKEERTLKLA